MNANNNHPFGEPIYSYTRKQAIEDGVLVDLTQFPIIRQHWAPHFACTSAVWDEIENAVKSYGKDYEGILHDLSTMAKHAIDPKVSTNILHFRCVVGVAMTSFKLQCGPGDSKIPVLTLMKTNED